METKQRIMSLFIVIIMIVSSVVYFTAPSSSPTGEEYFYNIRGKQVNESVNSLEDGLKITPSGVQMARYLNVSSVRGTALEPFFGTELQDHDDHHQSQTTLIYKAWFNNTWVEMNDIQPRQLNYDVKGFSEYSGYLVIYKRFDSPSNVMGVPILFGPNEGIRQTIDVIEGNATSTSYDDYKTIISLADPSDIYQMVVRDQGYCENAYIGIKLDGSNATRTTIYLNPTQETLDMIYENEATAGERGLTSYNVSISGDYVIVRISGPVEPVVMEQFQPQPELNVETSEVQEESGNETQSQ